MSKQECVCILGSLPSKWESKQINCGNIHDWRHQIHEPNESQYYYALGFKDLIIIFFFFFFLGFSHTFCITFCAIYISLFKLYCYKLFDAMGLVTFLSARPDLRGEIGKGNFIQCPSLGFVSCYPFIALGWDNLWLEVSPKLIWAWNLYCNKLRYL